MDSGGNPLSFDKNSSSSDATRSIISSNEKDNAIDNAI